MKPFNAQQLIIRIGRKAQQQPVITPNGIFETEYKTRSYVHLTNTSDHNIEWVNVTFAREHNLTVKNVKTGGYNHDGRPHVGGAYETDPSYASVRHLRRSWNDYGEGTYKYTRTGLEMNEFQFQGVPGLGVPSKGGYSWGFVSSEDYPLYQAPWFALRVYGKLENGQSFSVNLDNRAHTPIRHHFEAQWCFIATAAYQDNDHAMVQELRVVRDEVLARSKVGRKFIAAYYKHGPTAAAVVAPRPALRLAARAILTPVALAVRGTRRAYRAVASLRP
jgi:hypothetical protein